MSFRRNDSLLSSEGAIFFGHSEGAKRLKNLLMDPSPTAQDDGKKLRLRMTERGVDPFAFGSGQALRYAQDDDLPPVILRERSD